MGFPRVNGLRGIEFGTKGKQREKLNSLVLTGIKKATAGTLESDYKAEGEEIETIGEHLSVLDNEGIQVAVIKVTKVEVRKFSEVPDEFAQAEGEAKAIAIQAQAIQSNGGAQYVQLQAIEKWNGQLPTYMMGNTVPFVNVGK